MCKGKCKKEKCCKEKEVPYVVVYINTLGSLEEEYFPNKKDVEEFLEAFIVAEGFEEDEDSASTFLTNCVKVYYGNVSEVGFELISNRFSVRVGN